MLKTIKKAMNNDDEAFEIIMLWIRDDLLKIAYLYLENKDNVQDAIQETLINSYNNINKLKFAKYFKTWVIRILINECYKINTREKKYLHPEEGYIENIKDDHINIKRDLEQENFLDILDNLDEKYRIIVFLYYAEELKIREIAKILNLNQNTVKTRLHRGKEILKIIYEKENYCG